MKNAMRAFCAKYPRLDRDYAPQLAEAQNSAAERAAR